MSRITYQNWILSKRVGDITEFYGEGLSTQGWPTVRRKPGTGVMGHVAMTWLTVSFQFPMLLISTTLDMPVTRFEKMFLEQFFCSCIPISCEMDCVRCVLSLLS